MPAAKPISAVAGKNVFGPEPVGKIAKILIKHHAASHVEEDIMQRGPTHNFSTLPGEGFQQEAAQAYKQTNGKNAELQVCTVFYQHTHQKRLDLLFLKMTQKDQDLEAVATIRMAINDNDTLLERLRNQATDAANFQPAKDGDGSSTQSEAGLTGP